MIEEKERTTDEIKDGDEIIDDFMQPLREAVATLYVEGIV